MKSKGATGFLYINKKEVQISVYWAVHSARSAQRLPLWGSWQ
jgi:hypothetical protein